jgi:hypothetical protein
MILIGIDRALGQRAIHDIADRAIRGSAEVHDTHSDTVSEAAGLHGAGDGALKVDHRR